MRALAIIPARGGSKRIPRKNIKPFRGIPVIAYSIRCATLSGCFDEVMVSTDDAEIAEIAEGFGAVVPFMRTPATANDFATLADVVAEVLEMYAERGRSFDEFCCILPTAPLLEARDISESRHALSSAPAIFSAARFEYPIWRALRLRDGAASMIWPEHLRSRSQDLETAYHDAGMFYWARAAAFSGRGTLFLEGSRIWELPTTRIQDIDTPEDWELAEMKFERLGKTPGPPGRG